MGVLRGKPSTRRTGARRRRWLRPLLAAVVVFLAWLTWSLTGALTAPGTDSVSARLAEWGRDHGLGRVVLALEQLHYRMHPPATGGAPPAGLLQAPHPRRHAPGQGGTASVAAVPLQPTLRPVAGPALPGEGVWRSLVTVHGQPVVQAAFLRPDSLHTSYLAGIAWMSHTLRFALHPGFDQPGGTWPVPDWIPPGQRRGLVATWNGAFKMADAHGGFFLDHRTVGSLAPGAASEVFYRDGHMTVGAWGREVTMTPQVVGVRQNLGLLVDHGRIEPAVNADPLFDWGLTLGGAYYVFRSGVGVTAHGDVVYASGDALSAQSLARLLQRAGCVRAMELDINPAWVSFMSYRAGADPGNPVPHRLLPDYQRPANRYYEPTSRDFVAVFAR